MNQININQLYSYCKSLGYPSSESQFHQDLRKFLTGELDSNQLENVSGGSSFKSKLCASALSALSILGAGSFAGAVENIDFPSGYNSESRASLSWISKHKETIITGISLLGLGSPYIYKHSIKPHINNLKKFSPYIQSMMSLYLSACLLLGGPKLYQNYRHYIDDLDGDINKALENILNNGNEYSEEVYKKIMGCNDQIKHLIVLDYVNDTSNNKFFTVSTEKQVDDNIEAYSHVEKLIQQGDIKKLNEWIEESPPNKLSLLDVILRFSPEILNSTPQIFVPKVIDCTEVESIDFNIEFLNPANSRLPLGISILHSINSSNLEVEKNNFMDSVTELIESSFM